MTLTKCRFLQIPCYHYIPIPNSDTYPYCSNKIVVIIFRINQGLRICNTQTTHLPINIMTVNNITEILATYNTYELEELLQFVETKEGRFENLKRQLKEELAVRADVEMWSQPVEAGLPHFDYSNCQEVPF